MSLSYLLTYDALQFYAYLETLIASNTTTFSGGAKQHHSPWMLTDAGNIIFQVAKRRCYTISSTSKKPIPVIDLVDDEDAWEALDDAEGINRTNISPSDKADKRPTWLPDSMDPVLEELPKWSLLSDVILEAEEEIIRQETNRKSLTPGLLDYYSLGGYLTHFS